MIKSLEMQIHHNFVSNVSPHLLIPMKVIYRFATLHNVEFCVKPTPVYVLQR